MTPVIIGDEAVNQVRGRGDGRGGDGLDSRHAPGANGKGRCREPCARFREVGSGGVAHRARPERRSRPRYAVHQRCPATKTRKTAKVHCRSRTGSRSATLTPNQAPRKRPKAIHSAARRSTKP